jgi:hypothetical protein
MEKQGTILTNSGAPQWRGKSRWRQTLCAPLRGMPDTIDAHQI